MWKAMFDNSDGKSNPSALFDGINKIAHAQASQG